MSRNRYRIARGRVNDTVMTINGTVTGKLYRHGWWWICDNYNEDFPYDPEGPFVSKVAATKHLSLVLRQRTQRISTGYWAKNGYSKRAQMKIVNKHYMQSLKCLRDELLHRNIFHKRIA